MGSTERLPPGGEGARRQREYTFENLRRAFQARLDSDRCHFVTLSAALARAEENPERVFEDLQFRAHRLYGSAAIFEEAAIAQAAGALEQAVADAVESNAGNTDATVWDALEALVGLMGRLEVETAAA